MEQTFGCARPALPLRSSGNIVSGNSLALIGIESARKTARDEVYVIGNPPFLGTLVSPDEQRADMQAVFDDTTGNLDFVACWFEGGRNIFKARELNWHWFRLIQYAKVNRSPHSGPEFLRWDLYSSRLSHLTWANNARDKAAVHVVGSWTVFSLKVRATV